jgi:hypothetical protein
VHIPRFAANESLVNLNFAAKVAASEIVLHC